MSTRVPTLSQYNLYDLTPLPSHIPPVRELGATSAPLLSASFFIGSRCGLYNDDFMQCKAESNRAEFDCLKEGRRVTRCASSVIDDLNKKCLEEFRRHWRCLEEGNHQLWQCRAEEWKLNECAFNKLGLRKRIPDQPEKVTPVHLRQKQIFADHEVAPGSKPFIYPEEKQSA